MRFQFTGMGTPLFHEFLAAIAKPTNSDMKQRRKYVAAIYRETALSLNDRHTEK
jgi:hypothetical protein